MKLWLCVWGRWYEAVTVCVCGGRVGGEGSG